MARGGYDFIRKVNIGLRLGLGRHIIDGLAEKDGQRILISLKWQQVPGTTEQKVPFELISMIEALLTGDFAGAYIVLGGQNWRFKDFYLGGGLDPYIPDARRVRILALEDFVARANQGRL